MVTEYPRMDISIAIIILYLGILYFPSLRHLALNMALTRRRVLQMHDDFALWWKGIYGEEPDPELPVALKLPPNVIAQIASHLTPVDVALFAQTSRGVRAAPCAGTTATCSSRSSTRACACPSTATTSAT